MAERRARHAAGGAFYLLLIDTVSLPELYVIPAVLLLAGAALAFATRLGQTGHRTVVVPDPGDEAVAARAAFGEVFGSLAPNTIVIGHDPERNTLLVHQLRRRGEDASLDPRRGS